MSNKSEAMWADVKTHLLTHPHETYGIFTPDGMYYVTFAKHAPTPPLKFVSPRNYEVAGDCIGCDGYVLSASEAPYCPSCARARKAAERASD